MGTSEAIELLTANGYVMKRMGRGSHMIFEKGKRVIIISAGKVELSSGMSKRVRSYARKK